MGVEIKHRLAMESFKKEAKKRDLGEYYYCILDGHSSIGAHTIQEGDKEEDSNSSESGEDTEVTDT